MPTSSQRLHAFLCKKVVQFCIRAVDTFCVGGTLRTAGARTGLKSIFCYGRRYADCNVVKLREKILTVSQWIHLKLFHSPYSFLLAFHRTRYEATFESDSN